jgi:addiction module HigA family antidote
LISTDAPAAVIHPGETLLEEFMLPQHISTQRLAAELEMPSFCLTAILHGEARITLDTARRLAEIFDTSAVFWTKMQSRFDDAHGWANVAEAQDVREAADAQSR